MEDIQAKLDEVQQKFDAAAKSYEEHTKAARLAQIEMIRLQGEHRALSKFLPPKEDVV